MTVSILKLQLEASGIDTSLWGQGKAKSLKDLSVEIEAGETVLNKNEVGQLVRKVLVGGADIYHRTPSGKLLRLIEEKQTFAGGRERVRDLGHAVSEKMLPNEKPIEAMIRGIREELGVEGEIKIEFVEQIEDRTESPSYPGLISHYITYRFRVFLDELQFREEGYIEVQNHMTTYFKWQEQ